MGSTEYGIAVTQSGSGKMKYKLQFCKSCVNVVDSNILHDTYI